MARRCSSFIGKQRKGNRVGEKGYSSTRAASPLDNELARTQNLSERIQNASLSLHLFCTTSQ